MNCRILSSLLAVALMAIGTTAAHADGILADLEYDTSTSTWELYLTTDTASSPDTIDGSNGIASFVATFNGIDVSGATFASGTGALTAGSPPASTILDKGSGNVEITYGQDISESVQAVVPNVGDTKTLIADGTYTTVPTLAGGFPAPDGNFLDSLTSPFDVLIPDTTVVVITDVTVSAVPGDTDNDGDVDIDDLINVKNNFGLNDMGDTLPFDGDTDIDDLVAVKNNFGFPPLAAVASVPEPTSLSLCLLTVTVLACRRRIA
ncbi:MAG: hypothetical protein MI725_08990 [Pirellulales bacterium]|nr:hypothetical protein [Pirellulales bacterium]